MTQRKTILITGGAGFIGSHLADALLASSYRVRVLDSLAPHVHGHVARRPAYLARDVELLVGDVRDVGDVRRAVEGVDAVFHFAARVGVGQSMREIADYTDVNNVGTAVLLEELAHRPPSRLVVASSMSIYGEGAYLGVSGEDDVVRRTEDLQRGIWEPSVNHLASNLLVARDLGSHLQARHADTDESAPAAGFGGRRGGTIVGMDGSALVPLATPESKRPGLTSVYALSKYDQERMSLLVGAAYDIPTVALRFFNVYGSRQALSNPYTGVLASFASRVLEGQPPLVFEDGRQRRDFVHVRDVVRACVLALESDAAPGQVFNVGSGESHTELDIARAVAKVMGRARIEPEITGQYRVSDIRHCFADIRRARTVLGYSPRVSLASGLAELGEWLKTQVAVGRVDETKSEFAAHGLTS